MRDNGANRPVDRGRRSSTKKGEWGMVKWTKTYALVAILALGMLGCFATRTAAQQEGKITGSLIDFDGNPWASLPVKIKSEQGVTTESKTDAAGQYTFTVQPPQMQTPFEVPVEVRGADTPPINLNFKEILEKQNPEAAAKYKQQQAEQKKFAGMKEQFAKGVALLDQERAAKAELTKATADQKEAAKPKVADLSAQAVAVF